MKHTVFEHGRILRSAQALKAFFERKLDMSLELLRTAPEPMGDGDIQFGLAMSQFGLWGVRSEKPLPAPEHTEIYETFHTILGTVGLMEQRRRDLHRVGRTEGYPANVIPLRRPRLREVEEDIEPPKRWMLRLDCLIEAKHVSEIHKMALELHSHSARYAFLEYRDLDPDQRRSLPDLLAMGAISLFVPELTQLTMAEQHILQRLMEVETINRPLLMVGTSIPFAELRSVPGVHLEFLALLSRAYIKLSRPFAEYKDQGLIHYFLDSLSENPS